MHRETIVDEFTRQAQSFNASAVANSAEILERIVALAQPRAGQRWLDAACGPGVVSRALAPHVKSVVGVDATPAMVELARAQAPGNATFEVGDVFALDHEPASFEGALSRFAIHHLPLPSRMVAELARVTKPGGTVVLADHLADADGAWATEIERLRDPSHWASLTVERLRALGADAGLELEEEQVFPYSMDYADWVQRGGGDKRLIDLALAQRPASARSFVVHDGQLTLQLWLARFRRPAGPRPS
jgi:SAM-dependent methyltransferase